MSEFKSFAEFLQAAYRNAKHGIPDERLSKKGMNESTNADGGYLVEKPIVGPVLMTAQQKSKLWSKSVNLHTKSYGAKIPILYQDTRTDSGKHSKLAYWIGEGETKTDEHPQFSQLDIKLRKLVILLPVTDELMQDSQLLADWIDNFVALRIAWSVDRAMLYGVPGTSMTGIMSAATNGVVAVAEANPLDEDTLENFVNAFAPANQDNGCWYMSKENWDDIINNATTFTNKHELVRDQGKWNLYGFPVEVMEQMSSPCDLLLGDFTNYATVSLGDALKESSIQFKFDLDETWIRWVLRIGGDSFGQVYTLEDGSSVGTFIVPADCHSVASSSSSSESLSESSSSSSLSSEDVSWSSESSMSQSSLSSTSSSEVESHSSASSGSSASSSSSSKSESSSSSSKSESSSSSSKSESSSSSSKSESSSSSSKSESSESSSSTEWMSSSSSSKSESSMSESSSSSMSESSSSSMSESSSSSSESSSSLSSGAIGDCEKYYCATGFVGNEGGQYNATGALYHGEPLYSNGTYYIWYDDITGYWAMSNDAGDPQNQWVSSKDDAGGCPNGAWVNDDGTVTAGKC